MSRKMFVRLNKVDGVPDESGKGGWWIVQAGVPDAGRPGRKTKSKRRSGGGKGYSGEMGTEGASSRGPSEVGREGEREKRW